MSRRRPHLARVLAAAVLIAAVAAPAGPGALADGRADLAAAADAAARGDTDRALWLYGLAIDARDLSPGERARAHNNRGTVRAGLGRLRAALADFSRAVALDPDYAVAWNNRGNSLHGLVRYDEAIASYTRALRIDPGYAFAWGHRGDARLAAGNIAGAIVDYDRTIALAPHLAIAWLRRGTAREAAGDRPGAIADYRRARDLAPELADATRALERLAADRTDGGPDPGGPGTAAGGTGD